MKKRVVLGLAAPVAAIGLALSGAPAQAAAGWSSDGSGVAGVSASGTWSCSSTTCTVSGNVYDTVGDSMAAAINYRWTTDCCAVRVKNEKGSGTSVPFSTSHGRSSNLHFEVQELRYNFWGSEVGSWVRIF